MKTVKEHNSQGRYLSVRPNIIRNVAPEFRDSDYTPVVPFTESEEKMNRNYLKPVDLSYKKHHCKECLKLSILTLIMIYSCFRYIYLSFIYTLCMCILLPIYEILLQNYY